MICMLRNKKSQDHTDNESFSKIISWPLSVLNFAELLSVTPPVYSSRRTNLSILEIERLVLLELYTGGCKKKSHTNFFYRNSNKKCVRLI